MMTNKFLTLFLSSILFAFISCDNDDNDFPTEPIAIIIEGASIAPETGGPNQQNQVYIDLSTNTTTAVQRDSWDLGFYGGTEFRVVLNSSIFMAASALTETNIDAVSATSAEVEDVQTQVAVGTFDPANTAFVDAPDGSFSSPAIAQISSIPANNKVYLVNLGDAVGTDTPSTGSVAISGDERGWKKIRILKDGNDYLLQYADLDATTHKEINISKDADYNFSFFSFNSESQVNVEPAKLSWDVNFTVFTNEITGFGSYGYSDFIVNNTKASAQAYMIDTEVDTDLSYANFTLTNVTAANFTDDQRSIGSSWRNGGGPGSLPSLKETVFYVINDTDGNLYKVKFLALTNAAGERGYPEFVYSLLQ